MAARFVYWMNVSLDLFIEQAHDEQGGGDWMSIGDELHEEFNARAEALTMMVQGRKVFETMESFWPEAPYNTTVFGGDDAIKRLGELRASSSGDIGVGGADVATQLLAAGLLAAGVADDDEERPVPQLDAILDERADAGVDLLAHG